MQREPFWFKLSGGCTLGRGRRFRNAPMEAQPAALTPLEAGVAAATCALWTGAVSLRRELKT